MPATPMHVLLLWHCGQSILHVELKAPLHGSVEFGPLYVLLKITCIGSCSDKI